MNTKLAAINGFFHFREFPAARQTIENSRKKPFCSNEKRLSRAEYLRLVETAKQKEMKSWHCLFRRFAAQSIRVSELQFITTGCRLREAAIASKEEPDGSDCGRAAQSAENLYMPGRNCLGPCFYYQIGPPSGQVLYLENDEKSMRKCGEYGRRRYFPITCSIYLPDGFIPWIRILSAGIYWAIQTSTTHLYLPLPLGIEPPENRCPGIGDIKMNST